MKKTPYQRRWYVYIVECCDKTLYTGIAIDVDRRVHEHNSTKRCRYTRTRQPVVLRYKKRFPDHVAALKREAAIKRLTRTQKESLIS